MNINLMSANITAGAATSSADLLTDLKSGYLLGANPRKQFLAQFAGIFTGTVVTVLCFRSWCPTPRCSAPSSFPPRPRRHGGPWHGPEPWAGVARKVKVWSIVVGGLVGIILPLLARRLPKYEKWIPSAAGLGLAWTFQWYFSLLFFMARSSATAFRRPLPRSPKSTRFRWLRALSPAAR